MPDANDVLRESGVDTLRAQYDQGKSFEEEPVRADGNEVGHESAVIVRWHGDSDSTTPPGYLVKKLLPDKGVALLAGQSGAGKTFVALDLAAALAIQEPFFGFKIPQAGGTLVLAAEGEGTIAERLEAAKIGRVLPALDAREGSDQIDPSRLPIAWRGISGLSDPSIMQETILLAQHVGREMLDRHGLPLRLIVIDTLAAAFSFEDENAAAEATKAMQALQVLSQAAGVLVVAVAHYGKTAEVGVRGSSAFTASADTILACVAERDPDGKVTARRLSLVKSRRTDTGWTAGFDLMGVGLGSDEDGDELSSCFVRGSDQLDSTGTPKKPGRRPSLAVQVFMDALINVLIEEGREERPFGSEGPEVVAVDKEAIRREFYAAYPADGETDKQKADTKRQQFNKGLEAALAKRLIGAREVNGRQLIWKIGDGDA